MPPKKAAAGPSKPPKTSAFKPPGRAAAPAPADLPSSDDDADDATGPDSAHARRAADAAARTAAAAALAEPDPAAPPPSIPPALLDRLLQHHFRARDARGLKLDRRAQALVAKYMETFVREAMARARAEREGRLAGGDAGVRGAFLEVEDLERLAPQLILDF